MILGTKLLYINLKNYEISKTMNRYKVTNYGTKLNPKTFKANAPKCLVVYYGSQLASSL